MWRMMIRRSPSRKVPKESGRSEKGEPFPVPPRSSYAIALSSAISAAAFSAAIVSYVTPRFAAIAAQVGFWAVTAPTRRCHFRSVERKAALHHAAFVQ